MLCWEMEYWKRCSSEGDLNSVSFYSMNHTALGVGWSINYTPITSFLNKRGTQSCTRIGIYVHKVYSEKTWRKRSRICARRNFVYKSTRCVRAVLETRIIIEFYEAGCAQYSPHRANVYIFCRFVSWVIWRTVRVRIAIAACIYVAEQKPQG